MKRLSKMKGICIKEIGQEIDFYHLFKLIDDFKYGYLSNLKYTINFKIDLTINLRNIMDLSFSILECVDFHFKD